MAEKRTPPGVRGDGTPPTPPPTPPTVPESVDPGPYGRAKWKVRLAVPIFVIVLVLVTGEGLSRLIPSKEAPALWVDHPLCFQVQLPRAKVATPLGETTFNYETDDFGFRGASVK